MDELDDESKQYANFVKQRTGGCIETSHAKDSSSAPFSGTDFILPSIIEQSAQYDQYVSGAWDASELNAAVPSDYDDIQTDDFEGETDIQKAMKEVQEDVVPSDSMPTSQIENGIAIDAAEEDQNNSGGLVEQGEIGVDDGDAFGPDLIALFNEADEDIVDAAVQEIETGGAPPTAVDSIGLEKMDAAGDIGTDTAVKSAAQSSLEKGMTAFQSSNQVASNENNKAMAGQMQMGDTTIESATNHYLKFKKMAEQQIKFRDETYKSLKAIQSELMFIDNIAYLNESMLTNQEVAHKVNNRIHRLIGLQKQLTGVALHMKDSTNVFYMPAVALDSVCNNLLVLLDNLKKSDSKKETLTHIKTFISPAISYISNITEETRQRLTSSVDHNLSTYANIIQNYEDLQIMERDISSVLKVDTDLRPKDSGYTKFMRQEKNKTVLTTLSILRKGHEVLNAKTMASRDAVTRSILERKLRNITKQKLHTSDKNTANVEQRYPSAPFSVKHPNRRLNALETPLAAGKKTSVYVSNYNQLKSLYDGR